MVQSMAKPLTGKKHKFEVYCNIDTIINAREDATRRGDVDDTEMEATILEP